MNKSSKLKFLLQLKFSGWESYSFTVGDSNDWSTMVNKGVAKLSGGGIDLETIKIQSFLLAGELTVQSSAFTAEFSREKMLRTELCLSKTVKCT